MKRVTGIGGVFLKAKDPKALGEWYRTHLGIDLEDWGGMLGTIFRWNDPEGMTLLSLFPTSSKKFDPSTSPVMINYRVDDLDALIAALRAEGCAVDEKVEDSEYGKFGWVMDPEGNRIELWQPPAGNAAD